MNALQSFAIALISVLLLPGIAQAKDPELSKQAQEVLADFPDHLAAINEMIAKKPGTFQAQFEAKERCFWHMKKAVKKQGADAVKADFARGQYCGSWVKMVSLNAHKKAWKAEGCEVPTLDFNPDDFPNPEEAAAAWAPKAEAHMATLSERFEACAKAGNAYNASIGSRPNYAGSNPCRCTLNEDLKRARNPYNRIHPSIETGSLKDKRLTYTRGKTSTTCSESSAEHCAVIGVTAPLFKAVDQLQADDNKIVDAGKKARKEREANEMKWHRRLSPLHSSCATQHVELTDEEFVAKVSTYATDKILKTCPDFLAAMKEEGIPKKYLDKYTPDLPKAQKMLERIPALKPAIAKREADNLAAQEAFDAKCERYFDISREMPKWKECLAKAVMNASQTAIRDESLYFRYFDPKLASCAKSSGAYSKMEKALKYSFEGEDAGLGGCSLSFELGEKMKQKFEDGWGRKHYIVDTIEEEIEKRLAPN